MPRYRNEAGVVVDIPEDLAGRLGGYTPADTAPENPGGTDPNEAATAVWLAAEDRYRADAAAWLVAEDRYRAEVTAWLDAETAHGAAAGPATTAANARRGRK